jgi:hypothetical protein
MQGISAPSRTLCIGALALTGLCSPAHAASSVPRFIGVVADDPEHSDPVVSADALSALVGGAQEVGVSSWLGVGLPDASTEPPPVDSVGVTAPPSALDAVARAEGEFLKARLRGAEKPLAQAIETLVPTEGLVVGPAGTRALVLLAQVQFALGKAAAAEKTVEHGLTHIPRFPESVGEPPPEVAELVARVRGRLAETLVGALHVEAAPAGTEVFLAGVRLGVAPAVFGGLPRRGYRLSMRVPGDVAVTRDVDIVKVTRIDAPESSNALHRRFLAGISRADRAEVRHVGEALARRLGVTTLCVARVRSDTVVVARLDPFASSGSEDDAGVVGALVAPIPDADAEWRALGRACAATNSATDLAPATTLFGSGPTPTDPDGGGPTWSSVVGWSLIGAGAAGLGAGAYFGISALDAEEAYDKANEQPAALRAREDAQSSARAADVGFAGGGALVVAGALVLLLGQSQ